MSHSVQSLSYLGDQDVLRLDVPVETVVEVTEVDGLQGLPDDALDSRRVQMSDNCEQSAVSGISASCRPETGSQLAASQQIYNLN